MRLNFANRYGSLTPVARIESINYVGKNATQEIRDARRDCLTFC